MLNIPTSVKIGWRNYAITQGEHKSGDNGGDLLGKIFYEDSKIFLYEKLNNEEKGVTLLHEILHGILYNMGNELCGNENFVTGITENLYQVIVDNPEMFKEKPDG